MRKYLKATWSAVRCALAVAGFSMGLALTPWVILAALFALFLGAALVLAVAVLAVLPALLFGASVYVWPGNALRIIEPDGTRVQFWAIVLEAITSARRKNAAVRAERDASASAARARADAQFLRGKRAQES